MSPNNEIDGRILHKTWDIQKTKKTNKRAKKFWTQTLALKMAIFLYQQAIPNSLIS